MQKKSFEFYYFVFVAVALFFASAHQAKAVPPPDFIFNVTTQIVQFFTIASLLLSVAGSTVFQFMRQHLTGRQRIYFWIAAGVAVLALAGGGAWLYGRYEQNQALDEWLAQSKQSSIDQEPTSVPTTPGDNLDQLTLGGAASPATMTLRPDDAVAQFIRRYYNAIATRQFADAYAMSKQSVSFETFKSWYKSTTAVDIDKLQRIDNKRSSLELTLAEGKALTRYGVLMDVRLDAKSQPVQVESSLVRILSQSQPATITDDTTQTTTSQYFETQQQAPEAISNADFQAALDDPHGKYLVLDARENIEFENGHFPNATHVRFADLKAGRWIEIPTDRPIYVFCWSGIRGKEVVEFLRSKKILARYLETGANGWVAANGSWTGDVAFLKVYTDDRYKRVFTLDELKSNLAKGILLVDTRPPNSYSAWHIPGSINIPLMSTPSISVEQAFSQVPAHSTVITVCDDYVNCFDAKLTGVELERRGHTFLGRFAEPWRLKTQ